MDITFIDSSGGKEMNDLEIGDRVRVVSESKLVKTTTNKIINGMTGTVKDNSCSRCFIGVEFDDDVGGGKGRWSGKDGHCWYAEKECLEKIEETEEETKEVEKETKVDTLEQKILTALREEIGVDIGEEFDVYEKGVKRWTCKFEENGHLVSYKSGGFEETFIWKYWIFHLNKYVFKKKPFMPRYSEEYFYLYTDFLRNEYMPIDVKLRRWLDGVFDHGMLALGNVFRTKEEALKGKDKLLERMNDLLKEE